MTTTLEIIRTPLIYECADMFSFDLGTAGRAGGRLATARKTFIELISIHCSPEVQVHP
jgi:hypothetical protein